MRPHPRSRAPVDTAWQVLAGVLVAVGALSTAASGGPVPAVFMVVALWAFYTVTLFGALPETGTTLRGVVRLGLASAVATVALLGLCLLWPVWGPTAAALLALTSPPARRAASSARGRLTPTRPRLGGPGADQSAVDRAFARIVAGLEQDR